jgi:uncharacterized membrane protein YphA (DoxX/SURF4 family)
MFDESSAALERNAMTDWVLRGAIALSFALFGGEKFSSSGEWPRMFAQIGLGQWFRYFTGVVEMVGAGLVLVPRAANIGLALLACTMAGAVVIHIFVLHHPFNCIIPGAFCAGLIVFLNSRRKR